MEQIAVEGKKTLTLSQGVSKDQLANNGLDTSGLIKQ